MADPNLEFRIPTIETPATMEGRIEVSQPQAEQIPTDEELHLEPLPVVPATPATFVSTPTVSPTHKAIERILEEDLIPLYRELTPEQKIIFRTQGELTASKIEALLRETKVRVGEIIKLIMLWLSFLPGVNKFFIEQEAKLKADKILFLRRTTPTV